MKVGDRFSARRPAAARPKPLERAVFQRFLTVLLLASAALLWLSAAAALTARQAAAQQAPAEGAATLPLELPDGEADPEIARLGEALQQMKTQNPVVARVDGHEIRWADVLTSADDLPERYRDQIESVFPALLDRLVDIRLLADAARDQGVAEEETVRRSLVSYEDKLLSGLLLERYLADEVTTAKVRERYDSLVAVRRANREMRARHILVETEEEAQSLIAKLDGGAVFPTLAREHSIGPSAGRGGDLGYFFARRMEPAFAEALLDLEPGVYTPKPVETDFGWHVILLVDRRDDDVPSFLDMQAQLRQEVTKEAIGRLIGSLRQSADLEMFPEDGAAAGDEAQGSSQ